MLKNKKIFILLLSITLSLTLFSACSSGIKKSKVKYTEQKYLMGTSVQVDVCIEENQFEKVEDTYKKIWDRLDEISWRMNVFDEKSEVTLINLSKGSIVQVQPDTYKLLKDSKYFSKITGGAFDITVWPLIKLWKESVEVNIIPSDKKIKEVKSKIGEDKIVLLNDLKLKLLNPDSKIDLGAIAKGYAIDEVARILRENSVNNFFIDAGGDVYVGGLNCDNELWRIGIKDPRNKKYIFKVLRLTNAAVATSGNYEQYFEIEGRRWSHILNPITGYPQEDVISATVIAATAEEADALATALCVLGHPKSTKLIDQLKTPYASLVIVKREANKIEVYPSEEFKKYE